MYINYYIYNQLSQPWNTAKKWSERVDILKIRFKITQQFQHQDTESSSLSGSQSAITPPVQEVVAAQSALGVC